MQAGAWSSQSDGEVIAQHFAGSGLPMPSANAMVRQAVCPLLQ